MFLPKRWKWTNDDGYILDDVGVKRYLKMEVCKMKRVLRCVMAGVLSSAFIVSATGMGMAGQPGTAKAASEPQPLWQWNFESVDGEKIANAGTAEGNAALKGTAKVEAKAVEASGKTYLPNTNHVLTLSGGSKGSSYVELPRDLYKGITDTTGLTWSFWMKPDSNVVSYSRLFSSVDREGKNEFAFTPYANNSIWNVIFDDTSGYKQFFSEQPEMNQWSFVTVTISNREVKFYVNGVAAESLCGAGDAVALANRLKTIDSLVDNALGKTGAAAWTDPDCAIQLDDVSLYDTVLTADQVKAAAEKYGIDTSQQQKAPVVVSGDDGSEGLTEVEELSAASVDGKNSVRIWKSEDDQYYYSAYHNGKVVIKCSQLGVVAKSVDLSTGLQLDTSSIKKSTGKEEYDWIQGSSSHVSKEYQELSFTLAKDSAKITMIFRLFEDGVAYRYEIDGDTGSSSETTEITNEISSFTLPDEATIWTQDVSSTYEAGSYVSRKVSSIKNSNQSYGPPILGKVPVENGEYWVLLSEANVYNEENPYCASVFCTNAGSTAIKAKFGRYLIQETDDTLDGKTYDAQYSDISSVSMDDVFHTPWRAAIICDDLEGVSNSSLISDLNPAADGDFSWVEPGTSSWSWWSTTSDEIDYDTMFDYIDYAEETGQKYCLVDFGWERWTDYETKIETLVEYAEPKGVKLILWYGVNKFDQPHKFDLDNPDTIEEEFAWCEKMGVSGVKVDYLNSDSQFAMKVMYDIASIAAEHKLIVNYHGCTDPNGENRTFPNILSSEAVMGAEYCKWGNGSSVQTLMTIPYTRNVIGSMEFTPVCMRLKNVAATDGFMLAMPVVYESAIQTLAHSAYVYPGYAGSTLLTGIPSTWDESLLLDGYPGDFVVRARRNGENWYAAAMTINERTCEMPLWFLEDGETYYAYIYTDGEDGGIAVEKREVTNEDVLEFDLSYLGGCAVKFSKDDPFGATIYDGYKYYEAEDAVMGEGTSLSDDTDYVSGKKFVRIGNGAAKNVEFTVEVAEAGEHECRIFFVSNIARNLYVQVNDDEPIRMEKLVGVAGDGNAVGAKSITVNLNEGSNTISLYNTGDAPGIDRIAISKSDLSDAEVTLEKEEYEYSGKRNTPSVTVMRNGVKLAEGTDYEVYYSNCKKPGTATVTVLGTGEFAGKITKTYSITGEIPPEPGQTQQPTQTAQPDASQGPQQTAAPQGTVTPVPTAAPDSVEKPGKVTGVKVKSQKKKTMTVTFKKLKAVSSYQISYSTSKKMKKAKTVKVNASASKKVIKKLKSKKTYYVRVRAVRNSGTKKLYGAWSSIKKAKIK